MITVENFIKEYNQAKDKQGYLSKHVVNKYVNYEEKITRCQNIINVSMYKTVNDQKIFWINTPIQYYHFCFELIQRYTDIEIGEKKEMLVNYNLLNRNGLINEIIAAIPKSEYSEYRTLLDMSVQDELENVHSLPSFLETKIDAIKLGFDTISSAFDEVVKSQVDSSNSEINNISEFKEVQ